MPTINVSDRTMRRIENRAVPFQDQEPEDVIRRLLDKTEGEDIDSATTSTSPADLVARGGRIPHGTKLRATYKGAEYRAHVDDGKIVWNGQRFESPSKAAIAVIRSTGTDRQAENGWRFWDVKTPESGEWRPAQSLRSKSRRNRGTEERTVEERLNQLSEEEQKEVLRKLASGHGWMEANEKARHKAYRCEGRDGARAFGEYRNGKFTVFQGSEAAFECTESAERAKELRENLREEGILKPNEDKTALIFKRDETFSAPSPAAKAVLGRSANGWEEWKTEKGRTLDQIERK